MRSTTLVSLATAILASPLVSGLGYTPPPALVNTPNFLIYNAITLLLQQYAGTIAADTFSQLQSNIASTPVAQLSNVADTIRLAFNAGKLSAEETTLTASDQIQKVSSTALSRHSSARKNCAVTN